jgi:hypothetical protein
MNDKMLHRLRDKGKHFVTIVIRANYRGGHKITWGSRW